MILQSPTIDDYLGASEVIDWHDASIREKTAEVVGRMEGDVDKARRGSDTTEFLAR